MVVVVVVVVRCAGMLDTVHQLLRSDPDTQVLANCITVLVQVSAPHAPLRPCGTPASPHPAPLDTGRAELGPGSVAPGLASTRPRAWARTNL